MWKIYVFVALMVQMIPALAMEDIWAMAAMESGVPKEKIYTIAIQESGLKMSDKKIRPWPWTVNSPRGSMRFKSKQEAYAEIKSLVSDGITNIDIGIMQVNLRWQWELIKNVDILEPKVNIMIAAKILKGTMKEAKGDVRKAVAYYHSRKANEANVYDAAIRSYEPLVIASFDALNKN